MAGSSTHYAKAILGLNTKQFRAGVGKAQRSWTGFTSGLMRSIGPMAAALGAGGLAAAVIKTGATFEQQMKNIQAVTRSTTAEMETMEAAARDLGATTSFSATEVAEGMTVLAKATGSATKAVAGIEAVLKLAGSEGAEMSESAELMISSMNAFGISFEESARVANVFASAAQNSRMSVERLKDSMKGVSAMARELGLGLEETVAATSILVDSGLEAASAGVLLRSAFADIVKAGGEMGEALKDVSLRTDGVAGVLRALSAAGIEGEEVFKKFNIRGASTVAILQRQMDKFEDLRESITGSNAAWEAYAVQQDSTLMAWERVKSALSEVSIAIFQVFGTDLKNALDSVATWILANTTAVAGFALRIGTEIRKAAIHMEVFGRFAQEWAEAIGEGFANLDIGAAMLTQLGGLRPGAEAARAGEIIGMQFAAGFDAKWAESGAAMTEELFNRLSGAEAELFIALQRLNAPAAKAGAEAGAAMGDSFHTSLALALDPSQFESIGPPLGRQIGMGFVGAFNRSLLSLDVNAAEAAAEKTRAAHWAASAAVSEMWFDAFDLITDVQITGTERMLGFVNSMLGSMTRMFQRMIAEAIAARLAMNTIFAGMGIGGLLGLGLGVGLLASAFRSNNSSARSGGQRAPFDDALGGLRSARIPQLAAAGGGGASFETHVHVPAGAILYAQDQMGIRQIAETLNRAIEKTVKVAYRE